ncbi:Secretin receptor [Portunus trituberculatus]|uniref:Secretin receptor n=1 Tax=Portunus trituberculatus TaxID=210409 RepID=A0A5B7IB04_PORTR|nr:Secretin receptor [Portunus trituberculatus]
MWATLRATLDDTHCWTVNNVQWIFWVSIRAPVAISNLINFSFFLNVVRVLILKLRSSISAESMKYRKLGKSTLVLVPLFGVHYFVLWGLSTSTNTYVELVWLFLDQVFASFQVGPQIKRLSQINYTLNPMFLCLIGASITMR